MPAARNAVPRSAPIVAVLLLLSAAAGCRRDAPDSPSGVVVDAVGPGGAGERAGLRARDVLIRWEGGSRAGARRGRLQGPFALGEVEVEEGPRGLVIHGRRDGRERSWTMPAGDWNLTPRPEGADAWVAECWSLLEAGAGHVRSGQWPAARAAFDRARARAREAGSFLVEARAWEAEGAAALGAKDLPRAEDAYRQALSLREKLAESGENLGLAMAQGRVASVAFQRGNLAAAEDLWSRSLRIREREAPDSIPVSNSLIGLGAIVNRRGESDLAAEHYRRTLAIRERLAPGSLELAQVLGNLGVTVRRQGDLAGAETFYRRSLEILEKIAPEGAETGTALIHLGVLALNRGEWEAAEAYTRRALRIHEKHDPRSRFVAACLNNLGEVYQARGQLADAEASYARSLKLAEQVNPDTLEVATNLSNLGDVAAASGDLESARALLERALALHRRVAPGSLDLARNLSALGDFAFRQKQYTRAARLEEDALAIRRRLAPGSAREAESLYAIGRLLRVQGRTAAARERWIEAVRALEGQRGRLAHSEQGRTAFGARYSGMFTDLVDLLVERGEKSEAFHLLERSRARSFLALMAERDLVFATDDAPPQLLREQRRCDADYDQVQRRLAAADPAPKAEEVEKLLAQLEELRSRRGRIAAALRQASPRLGSLQQPEALDLSGARRALDPGTLLLSWSVGRTRTVLFLLTTGEDEAPLRVATLPVGEETLRRRITLFRGLVARGRGASATEPALIEQGRRLFEDLLGPARAALLASRRVLLVPDGPLHALPFAALIADVPGRPDALGRPRYLAELKPLHVAASVTVYAELKKARARAPRRQGPILVAFGDAVPTARLGLAPLPASRAEVEAVTAAYRPSAVAYLGAQATEDRAKALGPGPRLIHFAAHGLLDERFPLDSALALTPAPEGEGGGNGLLQAWEILERMRIDADLVTLSACESGLGREMGGEGLIGLSRAFQHAGASSVLASLWAVSDRSTAQWMGHFYARLQRGLPRDEAVQGAQAEMLRHAASAHPFHWAAFQLSGLYD